MTTAKAVHLWRHEIQHGPEGEADYAWVYDANGMMVCTAKTHHAEAIVSRMNTTASLQGEDAVERVARIPHAEVDKIVSDLMSANYSDKPRLAVAVGRAIVKANERGLATGLVPNESAIRADEREKCARIVENNQEGIVEEDNGTERYVARRMDGNLVGLAFAAAIRAGRGEA